MYKPQTLKSGSIELKYEYRINRALVIFTNFNDLLLATFADMLHRQCTQVEEVTKKNNYDDGTGSVVATMIKGFDETQANDELIILFNQFCSLPCPTTV